MISQQPMAVGDVADAVSVATAAAAPNILAFAADSVDRLRRSDEVRADLQWTRWRTYGL
jgi:hypothetical protein